MSARCIASLKQPFPMRLGGTLAEVQIAYETWGELNSGTGQRPAHLHGSVAFGARGVIASGSRPRMVGRHDRTRPSARHVVAGSSSV